MLTVYSIGGARARVSLDVLDVRIHRADSPSVQNGTPSDIHAIDESEADPRERFPNVSSADVPAYRYRYAKRTSAHKCASKLHNRFAKREKTDRTIG